jgi:hypothetical protein
LDDTPLAQTLDDSVTKRLRSNKGKAISTVDIGLKKTVAAKNENLKIKTKST